MDAIHITEITAAGIGVIAGAVQVLDYLERKKRERAAHLRVPKETPAPVVAPVPVATQPASPVPVAEARPPGQKGVVLLYKRGPADDTHVLGLLETELRQAGYDVFIDRHLQIGVAWAAEIERQITQADAVVVLLSADSVRSEMVEYEVQAAHRAAQTGGGRPRLLPVRVRYSEPLTGTLGTILSPLQYSEWAGEQDDATLTREIVRALDHPAPPPEELRREPVGGAVPLDSRFYVERSTDALFLEAIHRRDSIVLVKGARQIGKTSLLARGIREARQTGARIILTDLQTMSTGDLATADTLFQAFAQEIADQLGLNDANVRGEWNPERGANSNFERFLRREVLGRFPEPIVWGLDEVDRLFGCPYSSEVFGLFRSWHNRRSLDPDTPWARLTLAMAYATEAHLFITDLNQSPFNVGTRLALDDFTRAQVDDLNERYGCPVRSEGGELDTFVGLVGGQPYLVRRGLSLLSEDNVSFDEFVRSAARDEGVFADHLRRILITLSLDERLLGVVREMLAGNVVPDEESFYRLRSAGLIMGSNPSEARFRCGLYQEYLRQHLR